MTYVFAKVGEAFMALKVVDIFLLQDTLFRTLSFLYVYALPLKSLPSAGLTEKIMAAIHIEAITVLLYV